MAKAAERSASLKDDERSMALSGNFERMCFKQRPTECRVTYRRGVPDFALPSLGRVERKW